MHTTLAALFIIVSKTFDLPPGLLSAICYVESKHDVSLVHVDDGGSDSIGVCQLKLTTARAVGYRGKAKKLQEPETNIFFAGKLLRFQLLRYGDDTDCAIAAYNAGSCKLNRHGQIRNIHYVHKVIKSWEENR